MGPDKPLIVLLIVGAIACEDEENHVDGAVFVAVVVGVVDVDIGGVDGGQHQIGGFFGAIGVVLAEIDGVRAADIELRLEESG